MKKSIILIICILIFSNTAFANEYTCGNGICELHENYFSCNQDCPSGGKDNYCDKISDEICDPDCTYQDPDCQNFKKDDRIHDESENENPIGYVIGIFSIIGIIIIIIFIFKKIAQEQVVSKKKIYKNKNIEKY